MRGNISRYKGRLACCALIAVLLIMLPSCAGQGGSKIMVRNWVLEYPAPAPAKGKALPAVIKVKRFGAAPGYNTQDMVFRPGVNERGTYPYNRWLLQPADMVGDLLARDLRAAKSYRAVLGPQQSGRARFELEGGVLECLELDNPQGWQARLSLHITLLDLSQNNLPERVLLQKDYTQVEFILQKGAQGLALSISRAAQTLSKKIRADLHEAVKTRLK